MTSLWAKEYIDELKKNKKIQVLHVIRGSSAIHTMKEILFPYTMKDGDSWSSQFTAATKRTAQLVVYSQLKRTKKVILFTLLTGSKKEGSLVGEQMTYEKGMQVIELLNIKV